jgi:hypothetical protein
MITKTSLKGHTGGVNHLLRYYKRAKLTSWEVAKKTNNLYSFFSKKKNG